MIACLHRAAGLRAPRRCAGTVALCAGLLVGAACLWSGPARAAEATTARNLDLTYDVYLGGLHVFTFDVDMDLWPDRYRVTAEGETRGTIGWLYVWTMKLAAEGLDRNGRIVPRRYVAQSDWQSNRRFVDLGFAADGRYALRQEPPPEPDPDIEGALPETLPEGIVDPLSLGIAASRTLAEKGRCDQTMPVFDGRRRYDLTLTQIDQAMLPPSEYSIYDGPAVRCSLAVERISGFRKSWRSGGGNADATPPTIWLATIRPDLPPLPVRYDGAVALGNIVIHLTKAAVRTERAMIPSAGAGREEAAAE